MKASIHLEVFDETIVVTYDDFISVEFDRYEYADHIEKVEIDEHPGFDYIFNCDNVDPIVIYDAILDLTQFGINPIKLL
jgi:hypothetical protein